MLSFQNSDLYDPQPPTLSKQFPYTTLFRSTFRRSAGSGARATSPARSRRSRIWVMPPLDRTTISLSSVGDIRCASRSEEHTSELQSRRDLVCRLLLEKKKKVYNTCHIVSQN